MGPDWKLDRRDSGRLFWRRDSKSSLDSTPSPPPSSTSSPPSSARERVKFRYDVEVLEFWEHDADDNVFEDAVDEAEAPGDDGSARGDTTVQSVLVCVGCIGVILATISYQWLGVAWLAT